MKLVPITLILLASAAQTAGAQRLPSLPISVEVRVGAGIPVGEFTEEDPGVGAEAGPAFSAGALVHMSDALSVYGAYSRTHFVCGACDAAGLDDQLVDAGAEFGVQAMLPVRLGGVSPWLRAGGVYRQLTFSGEGGRLSSDPGFGFEAGGGLSLAVTRSISIAPGVRFRTYAAELELGELPGQTVDVSQVLADVGFAYRF
jgi:opacity protein-like surface antigen